MTIYDVAFDSVHDLHLDGSDLAFSGVSDIVKQRLTIRLQFLLAEWFLNNTVGLPYTQFIFEKGSSIEDVYELFRKEIKDTEGVENIKELTLTPDSDDKGLRVDFSVNDGLSTGSVEVSI